MMLVYPMKLCFHGFEHAIIPFESSLAEGLKKSCSYSSQTIPCQIFETAVSAKNISTLARFMPIHWRVPLLKLTRYLIRWSRSPLSHRSSLNPFSSGNKLGLKCCSLADTVSDELMCWLIYEEKETIYTWGKGDVIIRGKGEIVDRRINRIK